MEKRSGLGLAVIGGACLLGIGALTCVEIVTPGFRGVVTRLGTVQEHPMGEGLNIKWPWDTVEEWSVQVQKLDATCIAGSSDLQTIHTVVSVNYRLLPDATPRIRRELSVAYEDNVIKPSLQESVKAVIAKFQAAELLEKRAEVRHDMEQVIQAKLDTLLPNSIQISALNIENFSFEESFNRAIESKQVAEQEAQRAHNEVARERAEADKQIEAARGRAESRKLEALAMAEATRVEAEARARAITMESDALRGNPDILKLRLVERWNGVMPQVMGGDTGSFLFNLSNLQTSPTTIAPPAPNTVPTPAAPQTEQR